MFIKPGMSQVPFAGMTSAPCGTLVLAAGPIAAILVPSITTTAFCSGAPPSRFTTVAPTMALVFEAVRACANPGAGKASTRIDAAHAVHVSAVLILRLRFALPFAGQ